MNRHQMSLAEQEIMFGPIRPEGTNVSTPEKLAREKARKAKKDVDTAMKVATGENLPKDPKPAKKTMSIVNRVTEYGALFNKLNQDRLDKGLPALKTAMEVLIDAMQSEHIELKDKARIAEKLATFESSRAPIISIEHVQNIEKDQEASADEALDDFLEAIRKV
jgi:hypothetical protein